ncbi:MAG: thaumatin family protein, partial [Polyangiales bacterium]
HAIALPDHWGGRFWGRTGCVFDASGKGTCATADCGGKLECNGSGGKPPASLAEFLLSGAGGKDFYDVSLVDGYNLPIGISPVAGTFTKGSGDLYDCGDPSCTSDLNATCPTELQVKDGTHVIACLSACEKFGTDEYCCRGAYGKPETCPPTTYSKTFKAACPTAYSYAYDDKTSTFTCKGKDYVIRFCP